MSDKKVCEVGSDGGLVLPLFGDEEQKLPQGFRIFLYLLGLFWCFMGVAIIADVFMGAIEKVTSKKMRLFNKKTQRFYTYEVWNPTVANLTLMALGSSAPEILLNVIDILAKEFFMEGLGPGTIVGSAAFNLLMIIAVCIVVIPDGEVRYIKEVPVYCVTASWSIFAYVWLIIILLVSSPNVVEVWEGVLTFLFFPILTVMAFAADKGWLGGAAIQRSECITEDMSAEELLEAQAKVRKEHGHHLSDEQVARFLQATASKPKSRAAYRVAATRGMVGGKRVKGGGFRQSLTRNLSFLGFSRKVMPVEEVENETPVVHFEFKAEAYAVLESAGACILTVTRSGDVDIKATVYYTTVDGTAKEEKDYTKTQGTLVFEPGETEHEISVGVVDDESFEEDEDFFVEISDPQLPGSSKKADLLSKVKARVIIIDDDDAGIISFPEDAKAITTSTEDQEVNLVVQRRAGSCGEVKAKFRTEPDSALEDRDFEATEGEVVFADKQIEAYIPIKIKGVARYDQVDIFRVFLEEPEGGAKLDEKRDGGSEKNILTVSLQASSDAKESVDKVRALLSAKWDKSKVGHTNWAAQFKEAWYVNGGEDDDDAEPPAMTDKILHVISLPWKLLFACVPPTDYCGGWLCFNCSLAMIGFVTMLIGDMASLLGCVMCLPDEITAITFVALGTSLPDTFASKTAATQDPYADASVGNVTGSNSVNVFLGLGLPWMIAAIMWAAQGRTADWDAKYLNVADSELDLSFLGAAGSREAGFVVPAGSLAFSVTVFSVCAIVCIGMLAVRRKLYGGELGGPTVPKYASAVGCVVLWFVYISLSSWKCLSDQGGAKCPNF